MLPSRLRGRRRRWSFGVLAFLIVLFLLPQIGFLREFEFSTRNAPFLQYRDPHRADPSATQTYLANGHLEVNPNASHPILELISNAQKSWREKLDRASKTLEEAVIEYKRRYKRPPPMGFDHWWDYVQKNNIQLPDEYDFIHNDLEPFWGISPEDLLKIQREQEDIPDTYTIGANETHLPSLVKTAFSKGWEERHLLRGLEEILDLIKPIEHLLPPFRAIFSPHDNPNLLSDYNVKKAFLDAAKAREYIDLDKLPKTKHLGFASACPPGSPARQTEEHVNQFNRPPPRNVGPKKHFIHDHQRAMDPCQNPYIFYNHAQYVAHDVGPAPKPVLAAQFAFCSTPLYHDIQPPTFISWIEDVKPRENDLPWEEKTDERLMWRGSNTGMHHSEWNRWRYAQRIHLVRTVNEMNGTENVLLPDHDDAEVPFTSGAPFVDQARKVGEGTELKKSILNPAMMDIAFTRGPIGCDPGTCEYIKTLFEWKAPQDYAGKEAGRHKYFLDVDGNGWSSRFKRLITTNSLVFKATAYPEWWIDRIQPWVHYVPIQIDYSDLYDAYIFFRGGLYGEGNHDEMAKQIAYAGREWSKTFWRKEDMTAYFFRLLLEYARVTSLDREAMSFNG
ncbi:hypothetical protein D9613_008818 [Agrocybe pediades]|uniref:Glycosyl transferase CAP10 domain-containing protein n=1 Tax=Agrocybe pediades TaxID=84607 RepID=A0A8H4QTJ7_9AGAR|nr:hypothetical protein D9613_008818 [Agrocybe pediades]